MKNTLSDKLKNSFGRYLYLESEIEKRKQNIQIGQHHDDFETIEINEIAIEELNEKQDSLINADCEVHEINGSDWIAMLNEFSENEK